MPPPDEADRDLRRELDELQRAHAEAEQQLVMLQNLYSASVQFLGAKTVADVVRIVAEVLANLVGATAFSLFLWRPGERLARPLLTQGARARDEAFASRLATALKSTEPTVFRSPAGQLELCIAPLYFAANLVGVVVIDALLPQKHDSLSDTDLELLSLLSAQAAPALVRANKHAQAEGQNSALEQLLRASEQPSEQAALQGSLDETKLVDVFQLVGLTRKSGRLLISGRDASATFQFRSGELVAASQGTSAVPLDAASELVCTLLDSSGTFVFYAEAAAAPGNNGLSCDALILDAFRLYDESKAGKQPELPPSLI